MIAGFITLNSCGSGAPKCDDKEVVETVKSIILDNFEDKMKEAFGGLSELAGEEKTKNEVNMSQEQIAEENKREEEKVKRSLETSISNIITNEVNDELKSCKCEGTFTNEEVGLFGVPFEGGIVKNGDKIIYEVKTDSEGQVQVSVTIY